MSQQVDTLHATLMHEVPLEPPGQPRYYTPLGQQQWLWVAAGSMLYPVTKCGCLEMISKAGATRFVGFCNTKAAHQSLTPEIHTCKLWIPFC